jgi:hypothetical protein
VRFVEMNINDLDKILNEYMKHFGSEAMNKYFKDIIIIKKEKNNAISKKKIDNSSRSN